MIGLLDQGRLVLIAWSTLACAAPVSEATTTLPADAPGDHAPLSIPPPESPTDPEPESEPPLSRDEIRLVVRAKLPEVRACFDAGLVSEPTLEGRVALRFTIDAGGRVRAPEVVEDQLASSQVATCLIAALEHWQFPRPREGRELTIVYPFHFTAEDTLRAAGLPRVEGTLRPAAVGEVFADHQAELDECLRAAGMSAGSIGVAFTIDDAGVVTKISSYRSTLVRAASDCILHTITSWSFPAAAADDEARVNHDLVW